MILWQEAAAQDGLVRTPSPAPVSAFFIPAAPRPFVARHVSLSDPATASDVEPSNNDNVENLSDAVVSNEGAPKNSDKGDRFTLYVGNLPYGT